MDKVKINLEPIAEQLLGHRRSQPAAAAPTIFIAPVIGGLIGAGTALLLAPQSGRKTQAFLQRQAHQLKRRVGRTVEDLQTNIEDTAAGAKERISEAQQDGRSFLASRTGAIQETLADAKHLLKPVQQTSIRNVLTLAVPMVALLAAVNVLRARGV